MIKYVYPHLPSVKSFCFIRYAGSGLANSLFVYARSIVFAEREGLTIINPTWLNFDPTQWRLWSKDKRTYRGIFRNIGISGLKKCWFLMSKKMVEEENYEGKQMNADYVRIFYMKTFDELRDYGDLVRLRLEESLLPGILNKVYAFDFNNTIAVHVRLGDYTSDRLPINYYKQLIEQIHEKKPNYRFLLFSDGKDSELKELTVMPFIQRVYFGSAIADIFGIASCKALISSFSTFSDWGGI